MNLVEGSRPMSVRDQSKRCGEGRGTSNRNCKKRSRIEPHRVSVSLVWWRTGCQRDAVYHQRESLTVADSIGPCGRRCTTNRWDFSHYWQKNPSTPGGSSSRKMFFHRRSDSLSALICIRTSNGFFRLDFRLASTTWYARHSIIFGSRNSSRGGVELSKQSSHSYIVQFCFQGQQTWHHCGSKEMNFNFRFTDSLLIVILVS